MMDDRDDQQFNEWLQDAAKSYHEPRPTPREELWARIAAERERRRTEKHVIVLRPWFRWGLGVAAVLAVGIGIGRWTTRGPASRTPVGASTEPDEFVYRVAATQYLSRTEAFLTQFRADARRSAFDTMFMASAGDLLTTTRLMMDSPAARDPRLLALLEDLELVLAQIVQLAGPRPADEMDLIRQGLEQRGVFTRLRSAIPAGPGAAQGVL